MDRKKLEKFKEKWDIIAEKIGEKNGEAIVSALKELYSVYDDRMVEWMASLYDPAAGAWYHSRSGQVTSGFGPDVESTIEVFGFWQATGMTGSKPYEQVAPEWLKKRVAKFCYELQDEDGYFYHPQWGKQYYIDNDLMSRRSRDSEWCRHLIKVFSDGNFKYPLPGAAKASSGGKRPDVPKQWQSLENYMAHLEELDIKNKSYWACNLLLAEASERNMYSEVLGADLQKITLDFLDANNSPETGYWQKSEDGISYYSMNSLHKCSRLYNAAKRPIPNVEKGIRNTMSVIMSDEPTGGAVDVYNPWHVIGDCMYNLTNFHGEEGRALASTLVLEIYDWAAPAIFKTAEKIAAYKMPDGGMSYSKSGCCERSQGAPVAVAGSKEGDINGNCCASSAVVTSVYHALGLSPFMVPMFTEKDLENFINIIEKKEKAWIDSAKSETEQ